MRKTAKHKKILISGTILVLALSLVTLARAAAPVLENWSVANLTTNVQSITINKPSGTAEGDLLVALMTTDAGSNALSPPDGTWTAITGNIGTVDTTSRAWQKIAGASEPASYTFTCFAISGRTRTRSRPIRVTLAPTPVFMCATAVVMLPTRARPVPPIPTQASAGTTGTATAIPCPGWPI